MGSHFVYTTCTMVFEKIHILQNVIKILEAVVSFKNLEIHATPKSKKWQQSDTSTIDYTKINYPQKAQRKKRTSSYKFLTITDMTVVRVQGYRLRPFCDATVTWCKPRWRRGSMSLIALINMIIILIDLINMQINLSGPLICNLN